MWTLVAILVAVSDGQPQYVEVTRNLKSAEVCSELMKVRKERGTPAGQEMYLVCIPAPASKDMTTGGMKL